MESFTEQFRVECVVEQAIIESNIKSSLNNVDKDNNANQSEESSTGTSENAASTFSIVSKESSDAVPVDENGCVKQCDEPSDPVASNEENEVTSVTNETLSSIPAALGESGQPESNTEDEKHQPETNGKIPSSENLAEIAKAETLYPNVIVKSECEKITDSSECREMKEIKRKGSKESQNSGSDSRKGSNSSFIEKDIETILADAEATLMAVEGSPFEKSPDQLRVAVIGAGPAGLCAARHLIAEGIHVEVFEQCSDIGGTWVYTDEVPNGPHIVPLHSSLYHDLWTNLPKETMQFPDFPYREEGYSYLPSEKVLQYLVDYADHFNLHPAVKVRHQVKTVAPLGKGWSILVEDLSRNIEEATHFDAVMVCSGPNNIPVYPFIDGIAKFSGKQLHSRDYRRAEAYAGKAVLVVGLGPSGLDITYQLDPIAKQVYLSHNLSKDPGMIFPEGVILKPKVRSLFDKSVIFEDDTEETVDVIIYCTGYTYNFPFLTGECGLIIDQNVSPLYKHLINIEHPTMCIIGLPKYCPHQYMVDYQVRAFLNILLGRCHLPSREEMLEDLESDKQARLAEGQRKKDFHKLGRDRTKQYMDDLTKLGNLNPVPPVMYKLFAEAFRRAIRDFKGFRKYIYKIVDDENYTVEAMEEKSI